jgi:hypothetical protein
MLLHPCQTVWSVSQLPNGDIVTGGSDGRVRIWTTESARYALQAIREVRAGNIFPSDHQAYTAEVERAMKWVFDVRLLLICRSTSPAEAEDKQTEVISIDIDIR